MYLLDTNACIEFLRRRDSSVARRLAVIRSTDVALCSVVKAELYFGAVRSAQPEHSLQLLDQFFANFTSFPFDDLAAKAYGDLRAQLERQGAPIGPNDLLIAAIALANHVTLVTHNTREFSRVPNLTLEDWEAG